MRFIHLADVHLGDIPDKGCAWSSKRQEEIWETFRKIIEGIRKNPVDMLLIAGDLFHRQPLLRELKEVNYLFSTIPDTRVYLIAGNHDYIRKDSRYRDFQWSENVLFFRSESVRCVKDPLLDVYIYGFSYRHREIRENVLEGLQPDEGEGMHILLAHGGDDTHVPLDVKALSAAGFDYIALGHIHKPDILLKNRAAFSGAPEPLDHTQTGPHGYIEGKTVNGRRKISFVPAAMRSYETITLLLDEESTQGSLEEELKDRILKNGADNLYQVLLEGTRSPDLMLIPEKLRMLGNVLDVTDHSRPAYDLEVLRRQYHGTLAGDYLDYFADRDLSPVEEKALYYGIQALLG